MQTEIRLMPNAGAAMLGDAEDFDKRLRKARPLSDVARAAP